MIVSWGVALFIRSIVAAIFGGASRVFALEPKTLTLGGAYFTGLDVACVAATIVAMVALHLLLYRTRVGTALRALASNPDLAVSRGIPGERMIGLMWFISGFYAALGGALFAAETRLQPNMDLIILLADLRRGDDRRARQRLRRGARRADPFAGAEPPDLVDFGSLVSVVALVRAVAVPRLHRGRGAGAPPAAAADRACGRPAR